MLEPLRIVLAFVDVDGWQAVEKSLGQLQVLMLYPFSVSAPLSDVKTQIGDRLRLLLLNARFGTTMVQRNLTGLKGVSQLKRALSRRR